jgi:hypothetical protein
MAGPPQRRSEALPITHVRAELSFLDQRGISHVSEATVNSIVSDGVSGDSLLRAMLSASLAEVKQNKAAIVQGRRNAFSTRLLSRDGKVIAERIVTAKAKEPYSRTVLKNDQGVIFEADYKWKRDGERWRLAGYTATYGPKGYRAQVKVTFSTASAKRAAAASDRECYYEGDVLVCVPTQASIDAMSDEEFALLASDVDAALDSFGAVEDLSPLELAAEEEMGYCCWGTWFPYAEAMSALTGSGLLAAREALTKPNIVMYIGITLVLGSAFIAAARTAIAHQDCEAHFARQPAGLFGCRPTEEIRSLFSRPNAAPIGKLTIGRTPAVVPF